MKIEHITLKNFRCFGSRGTTINVDPSVTAFVGGNGSGKTAVFLALSRMFGITAGQRAVRRQDFHIPANRRDLNSGAKLSIDVVFCFPELEGLDADDAADAVPEFFSQMSASAPGAPLRARMKQKQPGSMTEPRKGVWMTIFVGFRHLAMNTSGMNARKSKPQSEGPSS